MALAANQEVGSVRREGIPIRLMREVILQNLRQILPRMGPRQTENATRMPTEVLLNHCWTRFSEHHETVALAH